MSVTSIEGRIIISDYNCEQKILTLTIENKGYFTVDGYFLRVTNDSEQLPILPVPTIDPWAGLTLAPGRYDFREKFKPGMIQDSKFNYETMDSIRRVQLQPFVKGDKGGLLACDNIVDILIDNCN